MTHCYFLLLSVRVQKYGRPKRLTKLKFALNMTEPRIVKRSVSRLDQPLFSEGGDNSVLLISPLYILCGHFDETTSKQTNKQTDKP